jgi:lipid-binding SYLF domain-containing protein
MNAEILTYSRAKGIFAGITLNGASVRRDDDSTEAIYRHEVPTRDLLTGVVPPPPEAHAFLDAIKEAKVQSAASRQPR